MFTGIIEHQGIVKTLDIAATGARVAIETSTLAPSLTVSNSVAVNGCCLTVVAIAGTTFSADLSAETLAKTSFGSPSGLQGNSRVNLEQPVTAGKELGGHFVLGHVDATGVVTRLAPEASGSDSWTYAVQVPADFARYVVQKGSITIDGISLTVARWSPQTRIAEIAVIPYTYTHTNIHDRKPGDAVNLEADILGKYIENYLDARKAPAVETLTLSRLVEEGF